MFDVNRFRDSVIIFLNNTWKNADWVIQNMDFTQWGIVAVVMVVLGFVALRSTRN